MHELLGLHTRCIQARFVCNCLSVRGIVTVAESRFDQCWCSVKSPDFLRICSGMATLMDQAKGFVADKIAHMEKPSADLTSVQIKDVSRKALTLKSDVTVTNPYDHDLPVVEISYRLRSNNREITSGTVGDPGAVPANGNTVMEVVSDVSPSFLFNLMKDIGADWDIDYDFDVGVKLNLPIIGSFTIPLHKKGCLKLPTLSDLF